MSYTAPVTKRPPLGIRFENDEQEALERAAALDDRPVSAMGRKIILDWLRANGHLGTFDIVQDCLARQAQGESVKAIAISHDVSQGGLKKALDRYHKRKRMEGIRDGRP